MTTNPEPHESTMIEEVRRWRREAYEADKERTPEERRERMAELLREFGLRTEREPRDRDRQRPGS